jgi:glycosyltransferase EpsD
MRWFKQQGWQVDYVSDGEIDIPDANNQFTIAIKRNPYRFDNIKAYFQLKTIILENNYDIIHCHTPMGGILGRLAAKRVKTNAGILYTAHGFHFYKGASLKNWLIYYPIEKYFAKYTDALITINEEDYNLAVRKLSKCKNIYKIDGVGVDLNKFHLPDNKKELRGRMGYSDNTFIILYVAEFTHRKNHKMLLNEVEQLKKTIVNLKIVFAGNGPLQDKCKAKIRKSDLSMIVDFLGYRNDIDALCKIADILVSPSKQEGLPMGIVEALSSCLPIVCSRIRGHTDVVVNGRNGFLFGLNDRKLMVNLIIKLYNDTGLRHRIAQNNIQDAKKYSIDIAISKMAEIYKSWM